MKIQKVLINEQANQTPPNAYELHQRDLPTLLLELQVSL